MRAPDAREIVQLAEVDPSYYSFDGGSREGALCLLAEGQAWKVFISERGGRDEEQTFGSEDDACVYFLKRLFKIAPRR